MPLKKKEEVMAILEEFEEEVVRKVGGAEVTLFGSWARDRAGEESDIDVLVVLDGDIDNRVKEVIYDIAYEIDLKYDVVLDVRVYSRKEWAEYRDTLPLIVNAEREGVPVHGGR